MPGIGQSTELSRPSTATRSDERLDVRRYSENGFEWTYEGPESRQLALAILADHLGDADRALALVEPFMRDVVANFDNTWEMTGDDVAAVIEALAAN